MANKLSGIEIEQMYKSMMYIQISRSILNQCNLSFPRFLSGEKETNEASVAMLSSVLIFSFAGPEAAWEECFAHTKVMLQSHNPGAGREK